MKNRTHTIEFSIFGIVCLVFAHSVYNLFTDRKFLSEQQTRNVASSNLNTDHTNLALATNNNAAPANTLAPSAASGSTPQQEVSGFVPYSVKCDPAGEQFETIATKVRLLGPFCGANNDGTLLIESKIVNTTSRYQATVFTEQSTNKFSTDFIPLDLGSNRITMEFTYKSGKTHPFAITVFRK